MEILASPGENTVIAWGGACAGADGNACTVTMASDLTVSATFEPVPLETGFGGVEGAG